MGPLKPPHRGYGGAGSRHVYIGPWQNPNQDTLLVYNVASRAIMMKDRVPTYFDGTGMPIRLLNSGEYFMIYTSKHCVDYRDEAFQNLDVSLSGVRVHTGGAWSSEKVPREELDRWRIT